MTLLEFLRNLNSLPSDFSAALLRGRPDGVVVNTSALESRVRRLKSRSGQFLGF